MANKKNNIHSRNEGFGKTVHYDSHGKKVGTTRNNGFGSYTHYDQRGKKVGTTYNEGFGRSTTSNSSEGCYIATCVYGYDSDEVWTLRKFRDNVLKQHFIGKCFIKAYYFISPKLVHFFGNQQWFHSFFKFILNPLIKKIDSQEPIK